MEKHLNWTSETAPKGKGKGYTKYQFTVKDVARMAGKHPQTVRNDISKGKLEMSDMRSICRYINKLNENT